MSESSGRLAGKVCIITGAGAGIGRATAIRFAAEGAKVGCLDIKDPDGVVDEIATAGGEAIAVQVDVTSLASVEAAFRTVSEKWGRLDVVYANAGVAGAGTVQTLTEDHWQHVIGVDLTGVWLTMRSSVQPMIDAGGGSIITQASVAAFMGFEDSAPYAAAKGAVVALSRQAAVDLGRHGIRVNAICPGMVPTALLDDTIALRGGAAGVEGGGRDAVAAQVAKAGVLGRVGKPEEIAALAVFLASDESAFITGTTHVIDGGLSAK